MFHFLVIYLAASSLVVKVACAQDHPENFTEYSPEFSFVQPEDTTDSGALGLDELEALLPPHLRTPLPLKGDGNRRSNTDRTSLAESSRDITNSDTAISSIPGSIPGSAIEIFYRDASGDNTISQYGYDFIGDTGNATPPTAGSVADDYVLGAGDRINISFLGERKDRKTYIVDRTGSLVIDLLPPLSASGKTLGQLREDLTHVLEAQSFQGEIYLNLERVRQLGILVAGHVKRPGRHSMTPLQTVLEAISQSGGITKEGSLRQIRLIRDGTTTIIDLYAVIDGTNATPLLALTDGDRIIVPPLGKTIAVTGDVRQPGIYELPAQGPMLAPDALRLAGGTLARGQNRMTVLLPQNDGRRTAQMVGLNSKIALHDGAILSVGRTQDRAAAQFTLQGETRKAGTYPLAQFKTLSSILRDAGAFGDDVYPLFGIINRRRDADLTRDLQAFSPRDIFGGRADINLRDGDSIMLLSRADIVAAMKGEKTHLNLSPLVVTFIQEHAVALKGAVRLPGDWPVAGKTPVSRLLDVAGGALSDADLTRAEISRNEPGALNMSGTASTRRDTVDISAKTAEASVKQGDAVRIPDRYEAVTRQSVTLLGEVRNPGTYDLMRGDTLLTLIDRAGGLTEQAYALGAVFSRAAERKREKEKFNIAARDLERSIAMAADNKDGKVDMAQMALAKELVDEMKTIEPVGRITVEANPELLRQDPAQDILLEAGDRIFIPKRPLTVRVTGEVMSPAALQFRAQKDSKDYISEAGGLTMHADSGRMFILFPNGSAQPLRDMNWTRNKALMIIPGSTIVVPRDPKPFDFMESAKDISQILSNLAITGIYADDLVNRGD